MTKVVVGGALVVSLGVAGFGFIALNDEHDVEASGRQSTTAVATASTCDGDLIDTHSHWDEGGYPAQYAALMTKYGVGCAVVFANALEVPSGGGDSEEDGEEEDGGVLDFLAPVEDESGEDASIDDLGKYPGRFIPFFTINPKRSADITPNVLNKVVADRPEFYRGFGEIALYQTGFQQDLLTEDPWPEVFSFLEDQNLWVMIHLFSDEQLASLEAMLIAHPNVRVLLHGEVGRERLATLLATYPNLYLTVDTSMLILTGDIDQTRDILLFPKGGGSADAFVTAYDRDRDAMLELALNNWQSILEAAPTKVMWGTDVAMSWHLDAQVYERLTAFSRAFIARLAPAVQEAYARGNAERLFLDTQ